jgi:hypothetical protein
MYFSIMQCAVLGMKLLEARVSPFQNEGRAATENEKKFEFSVHCLQLKIYTFSSLGIFAADSSLKQD